jgi:hypothetical protein
MINYELNYIKIHGQPQLQFLLSIFSIHYNMISDFRRDVDETTPCNNPEDHRFHSLQHVSAGLPVFR